MSRPDPDFIEEMASLEVVYLSSDDPIMQSGFAGGRERWVAERSPIVQAIDRDGDFLDVGCANGLILEDIVRWAASSGHAIVPHGIDLGPALIELAKKRLPRFAANLFVADAWSWEPKRSWDLVFSLIEPVDVACLLEECGYHVTGETHAGEPPISRFAWSDP